MAKLLAECFALIPSGRRDDHGSVGFAFLGFSALPPLLVLKNMETREDS